MTIFLLENDGFWKMTVFNSARGEGTRQGGREANWVWQAGFTSTKQCMNHLLCFLLSRPT